MASFFYNLGKKAGPGVRKAKWMWQSATGSEADAIAMENQVGLDLANEVRIQLQLDHDPAARQLLDDISSRLCPCVANQLRRFNFETVKLGPPNAMALPGGYIFITRSLLDLCQWDRDEVAFIMSHEMAHVIKGHAIERIMSNSALSMASRAVRITGILSQWLQKVGIEFLQSSYSQDVESEADKLAVRLAIAAGYNPQAAIKLFDRFSQLKKDSDESILSVYLSSHPPIEKRIQTIKSG